MYIRLNIVDYWWKETKLMVHGGITMSFCETLLYMEKLEVCEASWSSNDAVEEKPGLSSSWSWRESFWLKSIEQN